MHKRDDHVLALREQDDERLTFAFRSLHMAALVAAFAVGAALAVWLLGAELREAGGLYYGFAWFLAAAFALSAVLSLFVSSRLEIDGARSLATYHYSSAFSQRSWRKAFGDFEEIRVYRPKAGTGAGRAALLKVLLKLRDGQEIPLGTGFLGVYGKRQARELADRLGALMSLPVIEEPSVEHRH